MSISVETSLQQILDRLEQKIDKLDTKLNSTDFTNRSIFVGLILAILGGFAKLFGLVGNPKNI